jgi:hypothetical protein
MMALLNLEGTLVTSLTCKSCSNKVYNASTEHLINDTLNYTETYPIPGTLLNFTGSLVFDKLCLDDKYTDEICTPPQKDDAFQFFAIDQQYTGQSTFSHSGFVGLTPSSNKNENSASVKSIGEYLNDQDIIDVNSVTLHKINQQNLMTFGTPKDSGSYYTIEGFTQSEGGFWGINMDEVKIGTHKVNDEKVQIVMVNSYPYMMYQTSDQGRADKLGEYLKGIHPNITF